MKNKEMKKKMMIAGKEYYIKQIPSMNSVEFNGNFSLLCSSLG